MKHALHADVLIYLRPVNPGTGADDLKSGALLGSRFGQAPGPCQWDANRSTVDQLGRDGVIRDRHTLNAGFSVNHSAHARHAESFPYCVLPPHGSDSIL